MIRIETTAEFDAHGRFTVQGQTPQRIPSGTHHATLVVDDLHDAAHSALAPGGPTGHPCLQWEGRVLVWHGATASDLSSAHRDITDDRDRRALEGPWE